MKLLAVRDLNTQDPLPVLGPKVEPPAPPPPPALRPTATPGIMQRPDGKLETDLPLPEASIRVHDSVISPVFSETNKNNWWAFAAADNAKRQMRARSEVKDLEAAAFEDRLSAESPSGDSESVQYQWSKSGARPKRTAPRRTYDECEERFVKNFEAGYGIPFMAQETIYPIEALQDRIIRPCPKDAVRLYRDPTTGLVIIPLPGVPGADYFP